MHLGSRVKDPAPPSPRDGGGGGGWRWVVTAQGVIEAELIKGVLENAGIVPVVLDAHDPSPGAWMFPAGNINALVRVFVPASLLEQARLALLESGLKHDDTEAPAAPERRPNTILRWVGVALTLLVVLAYLIYELRFAVH